MSDCECAPSLLNLRSELNQHKPGWTYLGCCGDEAHRKRKSDHNPYTGSGKSKGYAHAIDVGESKYVPSMNWLLNRIMNNPEKYPQVKYMIYEGYIYYPKDGARKRGKYVYTGPNQHATHLHISIHIGYTFYQGSWYIAGINSDQQRVEEEEMIVLKWGPHHYILTSDAITWLATIETANNFIKKLGEPVVVDEKTLQGLIKSVNSDLPKEVTPA